MVKVNYLGDKTSNEYSDGEVENELLQIYKNGLTESERIKILQNDPSWPIRYHMAYERENLVNWYKFPKGARVLEIGSGCGAITEALVKNSDVKIIANELSERRALINAHRNKSANNLEIVVGNLQNYKPDDLFDYVVCVGVLEYAGTFIDSESPYQQFLEYLASFLRPGGTLLLAIENRMGFKYLSGAKEDHTGNYFDGMNAYPQVKNVRTFGREELERLLSEAGYVVNNFFYPHPDYKLPTTVYSDDFLPGLNTDLQKSILPAPNFDQERQHLYNEQVFAEAIEKNNLFASLANSFLVEAKKGSVVTDTKEGQVVFSLSRHTRPKKYRIRTTAIKKDSNVVIRKEALTKESEEHVERLRETYEILDRIIGNKRKNLGINISKPMKSSKKGVVDFQHIPGKSAEQHFLEALLYEDKDAVLRIVEKYHKLLTALSEDKPVSTKIKKEAQGIVGKDIYEVFSTNNIIVSGILDFNLDNFIIHKDTGEWWLIDYEWRMDIPIPVDFIEYRGVLAALNRYKNSVESRSLRQEIMHNDVIAIPNYLLKSMFDEKKFRMAHKVENHIQKWILGKSTETTNFGKLTVSSTQTYYLDASQRVMKEQASALVTTKNFVEALEGEIKAQHAELESLHHQMHEIKSSFAYKIIKLPRRIASKTKRILKKVFRDEIK